MYKNGRIKCAGEILSTARPATNSASYSSWLASLTKFLQITQQQDSASKCLALLERSLSAHSPLIGTLALFKTAQFRRQIQFEKALQTANEALQSARATKDKRLTAALLNEIGNTSRDIYRQEPDKYLPIFKEALDIAQSLNDSSLISDTYENLVYTYFMDNSMDIEHALENLELALATFPSQTTLFARYRFTNTVVAFLSYLSGENEKVISLFKHVVLLSRQLQRPTDTRATFQYIADQYINIKNFKLASMYLDSAQRYDSPEWEKDYFYENRAQVAKALGDFQGANDYYKKALEEKERVYLRRNNQTMTQWETQFRTRETALQLAQEKRQQWFLWGIVGLVTLLFFLATYSFWRNRKQLQQLAQQHEIIERQSQELRQLDEAKTRFFSNITHEFRTPLTLIISPLETLLKQQPKQPILGMIHANASRLLALINQLLDLSKIDAGALQPSLTKENLVLFLRRQAEPFEALADERGIELHVPKKVLEMPLGYIDTDKLSKIITNLLSNALKFTPQGGEVQYHWDISDKLLSITLSDSGIGIPPEKLSTIFDRFYQVDSSSRRMYEGSGIGLSLVKELVGVLKGEITVESRLSSGTTFLLRFPIDAHTWGIVETENMLEKQPEVVPALIEKATSVLVDEITTSTSVVLIVEDNPDLRTYIASLFDNQCQVLTAVDGQEGLEKAMEAIPDLIISDWMMPNMDGINLCQHLKKDARTSHIPVVLLTAKTAIESRLTGFEGGADDYIVKPFHATELQLKVKNWLARQEKLKKHYTELLQKPVLVPPTPELEGAFMERLFGVIDNHLSDTTFSVDSLADALQLNRRTLQRKVNSLTNLSPNELIRNHRLRRALTLLKQGESIADAAFKVGFETPSYFTKCFKETFGIKPSELEISSL
ncbi:signal transduction histidine kinase/DNA-binding response OmpR family regulator [Runella defluvii]|uniref:histidine kinase n=1 Tax=Runella defluvii TaxID=370973 RepID=A0A7W5ZQ69_9BACT|nr:ATP-binding protein [Runella defluvii]MBB3841655.1 signal transduction histidine kinase/DNA-binding response OmpR family regulator [Runella defluvii]